MSDEKVVPIAQLPLFAAGKHAQLNGGGQHDFHFHADSRLVVCDNCHQVMNDGAAAICPTPK
jgi:hypothetical protein